MFRKALALMTAVAAVGLVGMLSFGSVAAQQTGPTATRSFDPDPVVAGENVVVTIEIADLTGFGSVEESWPEGFTYQGSSLGSDASPSDDGLSVNFVLFQFTGSSFTYTLQAPSDPGTYTFAGHVGESPEDRNEVGGDPDIEVVAQTYTPSASRTISPSIVTPGGQLEVTIAVADYGSSGTVRETLPTGFQYDSTTHPGQVTESGSVVEFALTSETSVTYTVTASNTVGPYSVSGVLTDAGGMDHDVTGDSNVTVQAEAMPTPLPSGLSASRSLSSSSVGVSEELVVTINVAGYGSFGAVVETLPAGFAYKSSSLDAGQVDPVGQDVTFTLLDETSFTYTVTASDVAGRYDFSGNLLADDGTELAVGSSSVTVRPAEARNPSVSRRLSSSSVAGGDELDVTITVANYGSFGAVIETLPDGFAYKSSSLDDSQVDSVGQDVTFTLLDETSFTYTVSASFTAGRYDFSGKLLADDGTEHDVRSSSVTVTAPPPTNASRRLSSSSVAGGEDLDVTVTVARYGSFGAVVETLPAGFAYKSSTLDTGQVDSVGQDVTFTLLDETSFTYTVTAPNVGGRYDFSGKLLTDDGRELAVGSSSITVTAPLGPGAPRSLPRTVAPSSQFVVTITARRYGDFGAVTENLPTGFAYVGSSLPAEDVSVDGQVVTFTLLSADLSFTYRVTAPAVTGSYTFAGGSLRGDDRQDHAIADSTITVRVPTTPTPRPSTGGGSGGGGSSSGGGGGSTFTPRDTPTPTPPPTSTPTPPPTSTPTPPPTSTPPPPPTSTPPPPPTSTPQPQPTATPTPEPTATPTPEPTATPTPEADRHADAWNRLPRRRWYRRRHPPRCRQRHRRRRQHRWLHRSFLKREAAYRSGRSS